MYCPNWSPISVFITHKAHSKLAVPAEQQNVLPLHHAGPGQDEVADQQRQLRQQQEEQQPEEEEQEEAPEQRILRLRGESGGGNQAQGLHSGEESVQQDHGADQGQGPESEEGGGERGPPGHRGHLRGLRQGGRLHGRQGPEGRHPEAPEQAEERGGPGGHRQPRLPPPHRAGRVGPSCKSDWAAEGFWSVKATENKCSDVWF